MSNLGLIELQARVPRRSMPNSGIQQGLRASVTVQFVAPGGMRRIVPSIAKSFGGGGRLDQEWVSFVLEIPIDTPARDAAIRQYYTEMAAAAAASADEKDRALAAALQALAKSRGSMEALSWVFRQHRVGHFHVQCRVLDGDRVVGVGAVELEILNKGRFFDQPAFRDVK